MDNKTEEWFYSIARDITQGKARGQFNPVFGNLYWEPEELAYLQLMYKDGDPVEFARREILHRRKS